MFLSDEWFDCCSKCSIYSQSRPSSHGSCWSQELCCRSIMYHVAAHSNRRQQAVFRVACSMRISESVCGLQRRWPQAHAGDWGTCPLCLLCCFLALVHVQLTLSLSCQHHAYSGHQLLPTATALCPIGARPCVPIRGQVVCQPHRWALPSAAVTPCCSHTLLQSRCAAVIPSCSYALLQSCCAAVTLCSHALLQSQCGAIIASCSVS